ncbi:MAG: PPC domain-containing protein [Deltaproteobacteria bacterium]|nr:PPC domain-containing protein [Deltaproteobacteria bacterium]
MSLRSLRFTLCALALSGCAVAADPNEGRDASVDRRTPTRDVAVMETLAGECVPGEARECYTGPEGSGGVGTCRPGTETCNGMGSWSGSCIGERLPSGMEACGNSMDDDCNGMTDEMCGECTAGMSRPCYTGPALTMGVGICAGGMQTCAADRTWPTTCTGETTPATEMCGNSRDDNCNGMTDEMCGECTAGDTRPCYTGAAGTDGRGICRSGTQTCGTSRMWLTACPGEVTPQPMETCGNTMDDNCNGMTDEGCGECTAGMTRTCYTGAAGTAGVGICRNGSQTCTAARTWPTTCAGEVSPAASETCGNTMDDNCNGMTDEGCGECTAGMTRTCYTGAAGTAGVGICRNGSQTCSAARTWPATCTGEVRPAASETCGNTMDDNCNGMTDEGCVTRPANDDRASATLVTLRSTELTVTGSTVSATRDGPTSTCVCTSGGNVWYRFVLATRSIVYADTAGSAYDTSLMLTDSAGGSVANFCNDDASCTTGGFTNTRQSRVAGALNAGTYYLAVGGCTTGAFTLHLQQIPTNFGAFVYSSTALSGTGTTLSTSTLSSSARAPTTCGAGAGGEDVRYFVTCGAQQQFFSLCQSDGASYVRRNASGVTFDPVMYLWSAQTGSEVACNDDGSSMGGTNCQGTGGDTLNFGSRLNNITVARGLGAVLVDSRVSATSGLTYTMRYTIR